MENKGIGFRLVGIKTNEFATFEEHFQPKTESQGLGINISFELGKNLQDISCVLVLKLSQEDQLVVKLKISCSFKLTEEAVSRFKDDSKIIFPKSLMSHFGVLTVGTARGVLHSKTDGTILNGLVLPTINLSEIIKEDIVFDLDTED